MLADLGSRDPEIFSYLWHFTFFSPIDAEISRKAVVFDTFTVKTIVQKFFKEYPIQSAKLLLELAVSTHYLPLSNWVVHIDINSNH